MDKCRHFHQGHNHTAAELMSDPLIPGPKLRLQLFARAHGAQAEGSCVRVQEEQEEPSSTCGWHGYISRLIEN